jgi:uncharacterized protein YegP (UPF0339 family)
LAKDSTILAQDPSIAKWMDFDLLRKEGIQHIADLSGDVWTDHNLHDPGITILEVLCYALTDLGYRNSLPIEDLLAKKPGDLSPDDNFFTPAELLTCNPLTVLDYRKMLMNIDGVRNAWLEPVTGEEAFLSGNDELPTPCDKNYLNGLYKVIIELDAFAEGKTLWEQEGRVDGILKKVEAALHSHRNLCEDFLDVFVLGDEEISILADIEIVPDADPDDVMRRVMVALQKFLSPEIRYYTLKELLAKKKTISEIFLGRPAYPAPSPESPNFGFIDTEELEQIKRKTELHSSDFYRVIMCVEGVRAIRNLRLYNFIGGLRQTSGEDWHLRLSPRLRPVMSPLNSELRFFKNNLAFIPDKHKVNAQFRNDVSISAKTHKTAADLDEEIPKGQYREGLGEHYSIQHDFPLIYRVGANELPESAPLDLKIKKQQLKGYLLFFDQLFANYLAQLAHLRDLFRLKRPNDEIRTTFFQPLENPASGEPDLVPEIELLLRFPKNGALPNHAAAPLNGDFRYATVEQRDLAILRLTGDFKDGRVRMTAEGNPVMGSYRYLFTSEDGGKLSGDYDFNSAYQALQAGEVLNFCGTQESSYEKVELTGINGEPYYSFRLTSRPVSHAGYLKENTETAATAENRRTRFLNHLLARFAEEFTDYSLLMYALEGKRREERTIIADKEIFLSRYPDLSRNRGRAFNYKQPAGPGNTSGLEFRVKGLLGILSRNGESDGSSSASLSNIELASWRTLHFAQIKNTRGQVVFEGVRAFASTEDAEIECLKIKALARDAARYEVEKCLSKGLFRLLLNSEKGEPLARHPEIFEAEVKAWKKRDSLVRMAVAGEGYLLFAKPFEASGWFTLFDDKGRELMKSQLPYPDLNAARQGWHRFVQLLQSPEKDYFRKEPDEYSHNFGFALAAENKDIIARHPRTYATTKARTAALEACKTYAAGKKLNYEIRQETERFRWFLGKKAKLTYWLESATCFSSVEQAKANQDWFATVAKKRSYWHDRYREEDGMYGYFVQEAEGYRAAYSPWFKTETERDEAKRKAQMLFLRPNLPYTVEQLPETWTFHLFDDKGQVALRGEQEYQTEAQAQWAFYDFTEKAADPGNYRLVKEGGSCRYSFLIPTPYCGALVTHPAWYASKKEAKAALNALAEMIDKNRLRFAVGYAEKTWQPEIHWENAEGWSVPLLVGGVKFPKADTALAEARVWATGLKSAPESLRPVPDGDGYSFKLRWKPEGETAARNPVKYKEAAVRDAELEKARELFKKTEGWKSGVVDRNLLSGRPGDPLQGFRLVKKGNSIARHPLTYIKAESREAVFTELIRLGKTETLPYSDIALAEDSVEPESYRWKFVIKDAQAGGQTWWVSAARFYSEEEAVKGFQQNYLPLLQLASCEANYDIAPLPECKWKIVLLDKDKLVVAEAPGIFSNKEAAQCAIEAQVWRAKTYPFFKDCDGWRYRIVQPGAEEDTTLWVSNGVFETLEKTDAAFRHFLHLATYPGNYHRTSANCRFEIELREILLESSASFPTVKEAWEQANVFSNQADEENAYYLSHSTDDLCRYGFRVVRSDYVLARHSRRYRRKDERETALHRLHAEAAKDLSGFSNLSYDFCRKGNEIYFTILDKGAGSKELWRSAEGFPLNSNEPITGCPPGTDDPAEFARQYYLGSENLPEQYRNYYLTLFEHARFADYYRIIREDDGKFRLGLRDANGKTEWVSDETRNSEEACKALAANLIRIFRRYPVLKEGDQYYFQYYSFDEDWSPTESEPTVNGIIESGKILWESARSYPLPEDAGLAFGQFVQLLDDKSNYQRQAEKGHYFYIEVTDPAAVLATHPLTYASPDEVQQVMDTTASSFNAEGFHLIEHILLRPLRGSGAGNQSVKTCLTPGSEIHYTSEGFRQGSCGDLKEEKQENCLVPFADPYSFWVSVVIPYWPRRFQNADFRKFFENTLRRETPAHIALRIYWVNPEQMSIFETKYDRWLSGLGMEGDCLRGAARDEVVNFLFGEIIPGTPCIQLDGASKSHRITLNETRLTL